jgi:hypothetical protein
MYATQASVVIVNPAGTRLAPSTRSHLCEVGALAAEQVAHLARALVELIDVPDGGCRARLEPPRRF